MTSIRISLSRWLRPVARARPVRSVGQGRKNDGEPDPVHLRPVGEFLRPGGVTLAGLDLRQSVAAVVRHVIGPLLRRLRRTR